MSDALVGRQPIYDRRLRLYGYELLFRQEGAASAQVVDGDEATSAVILDTFTALGLNSVVGPHKAFLNLTRSFLVGDRPLPFEPEGVVLEVLEDVEPEPEVLAGLRRLRARGYTIALDDFCLRPELMPLVELADIVKFDCHAQSLEESARQMEAVRNGRLVFLAEKIEEADEFQAAHDLGFDLFQGYFLCRPNLVRGKRAPSNRVSVMGVLARLMDPRIDLEDIEELVATDVTLSYKLLRHANSVNHGLQRRVESLRETVVLLGVGQLRNLISLMLLAGLEDTPQDLVLTSMVRGKMSELLASQRGDDQTEAFFTAGMLSILEALLGTPVDELVGEIPISEAISGALTRREGELGAALDCVLAYERGDWDRVRFSGLDDEAIRGAFLQAVEWSVDMERKLLAAA